MKETPQYEGSTVLIVFLGLRISFIVDVFLDNFDMSIHRHFRAVARTIRNSSCYGLHVTYFRMQVKPEINN
jgi:hypothetical protein